MNSYDVAWNAMCYLAAFGFAGGCVYFLLVTVPGLAKIIWPIIGILGIMISCIFLLAGCATQAPETIVSTAPGFWLGVWHGFTAGFALIGQLFDSSISIYSVPNNGAPYGFGWVIGLVLSCGSATTGTVRWAHPRYYDPIYRGREDDEIIKRD